MNKVVAIEDYTMAEGEAFDYYYEYDASICPGYKVNATAGKSFYCCYMAMIFAPSL